MASVGLAQAFWAKYTGVEQHAVRRVSQKFFSNICGEYKKKGGVLEKDTNMVPSRNLPPLSRSYLPKSPQTTQR